MIQHLLWPNLPEHLAHPLAVKEGLGGVSPVEWEIDRTRDKFDDLGGSPVEEERIQEVVRKIRDLAAICGYPERTRDGLRRFDRQCGPLLLENMGISPHQANSPGIWAWLTCIALPDLVRWRWKANRATGRVSEARFLRINRNTFGRLWWRAWVLHDPSAKNEWRLLELSEDNLVAIMERTRSIASSRVLAVAFATEILNVATNRRMPVMRDATKRVLRTLSVRPLRCLPEQVVKLQIRSEVAVSTQRIRDVNDDTDTENEE